MIKVCDAIMGTGKSSAAITYINEHPDYKFIYITPYLDEAARIKEGCQHADFIEPSNKLSQYHFRKSTHTAALIKEGRNISTTHQAFKGYTTEMLEGIRRLGYTLIIDENVDVLEPFGVHENDLQITVDAGYVKECDGVYTRTDKPYSGTMFSELFSLLTSRDLIRLNDDRGTALFYWTLPPELLTSFRDVFVLTYLFPAQSLHHLMSIYGIKYEYIGIDKSDDGTFRFGDYPGYTPEYVKRLPEMLNILEHPKLNEIGNDYCALSMNWFRNNKDGVEQLKKNLGNCYNNIWRDIPADRRLWGAYNGAYSQVRGKGYSKSFLTFNSKATNKYRDKDCLVYITNLFMNVNEKRFYQMHGVEVDEDMYALSIMVQWIWRSAIRDGARVNLYIPSSRMRALLTNWIQTVSNGGEYSVGK